MRPGHSHPVGRYVRLLAGRPLFVLAGGIVLAVVGEVSSVAMLGLSAWFIVNCYFAGLSVTSGFTYLTPSGGVRALALSRVGARYSQRLVSHSASLQWSARIRLQMFDDAAGAPLAARRLRDGEVLDRTVADADVLTETLIRAVQPLCVAAITAVGAVLAVAVCSPAVAIVFAVGAASTVVVAAGEFRATPAGAIERGRARAEMVAATEAWPELVSLGAAEHLRAATRRQLTSMARASARQQSRESRTRLRVDAVAGATLVAEVGLMALAHTGMSLALMAFTVMLAIGTLDLFSVLPAAAHSVVAGREAAERLNVLAAAERLTVRAAAERLSVLPGVQSPASTLTAALPHDAAVQLNGVRLPHWPASARALDVTVPAGGMLLVSGRSGIGKTTLLRTIYGELTPAAGTVGVASGSRLVYVEHDDYVFAATAGENLRLADPDLDRETITRLLDAVRLTDAGISADTPVGTTGRALSGGELRRLALARAVAARPAVLLLDEPTEGLDQPTARAVLAAVRALLPDTAIIAAVHDKHVGWIQDENTVCLRLGDAPNRAPDVQRDARLVPVAAG